MLIFQIITFFEPHNSAQLRNSIESLQNPNRSIIKMNGSTPNPNQTLPATSTNPNTTGSQGSKSSTPLTEIPTPKSVIQQNQNQTTAPPSAVTPEPSDDITDDVNGQNDVTPASERNSVVRSTVDDAAAAAVTAAVAAQVTAGVGALQKDVGDIRRPTKSVISDSLLSDNGTETTTPVPQTNGQEDGQVSNEAQSVLNNFTNNHAMLNQRFVTNFVEPTQIGKEYFYFGWFNITLLSYEFDDSSISR